MAKMYLTLDEAAADLGIHKDELNRLRERGEVRGFADRGTWKFRPQDLEPLRERLANGDVTTGDDETVPEVASSGTEPPEEGWQAGLETSDSDVRLSSDDVPAVRPDSDPEVQLTFDSDSDVRLAGGGKTKSDSDVALAGDSDSDVKLAGDSDSDSDSDVALVDSDSDVRLAEDAPALADSDSDVALVADSDSDVRLTDEAVPLVDRATDAEATLVDSGAEAGESDSDSDVRLTDESTPLVDLDSDSDVQLVAPGSDSDVRLAPIDETVASVDSDSDVALLDDAEETIAFTPAETPSAGDAEEESGISLATESGISLDRPVDSGISLEEEDDSGITLDDESGISLDLGDESGIALDVANGGDATESIPVLPPQQDEGDVADTVFEVPTLGSEGDVDFELKDSDAETSVLLFDDEGDQASTAVKPTADSAAEETFEFDVDEDQFGEAEGFAGDLEMGDEEVQDLDVFDAEDADFEEAFDTGESQADFVAPVGLARAAAAVETEWGASVFIPLIVSSILLCLCGTVMYDLVRTMWGWQEVSSVNSPLLDLISSLF